MRELTTKEIEVCNLIGVFSSLALGFLGMRWLGSISALYGLLGTYIAAIPVIIMYSLYLWLRGEKIKAPKISFNPSIKIGK